MLLSLFSNYNRKSKSCRISVVTVTNYSLVIEVKGITRGILVESVLNMTKTTQKMNPRVHFLLKEEENSSSLEEDKEVDNNEPDYDPWEPLREN